MSMIARASKAVILQHTEYRATGWEQHLIDAVYRKLLIVFYASQLTPQELIAQRLSKQ